jgi:cell division protease FtsH
MARQFRLTPEARVPESKQMNERDRRFRQFSPHGPRPRLLPPLGALDAAMKCFNFGVATPMDAVSESLPRKVSRKRPRKPTNADVVAATVALKAVLPAGLLDTFGHGQTTTLVIQVPSAGWCIPIKDAFFDLLNEAKGDGGLTSQAIWKFVWDGNQRAERPTACNDEVAKAVSRSTSILGISPNPKRILPRTLTAAPDFYVVVSPLNGGQAREVISVVTGRKVRKPVAAELVAGLDPTDFAVAIRPGSKPAECEARLRKFAAARVAHIGDDTPRLQDLAGCDEARDWGLGLATDIALYKQGRIGWGHVAEVGAVLVGDPGVGKTQLAKSLARTLEVPLIMTSYAAWQSHREGHLGDLLSEMRRSANEALSLAPSIWFVDEIDSMPNRNGEDIRYREWYVAVVNGLLEISERGARPGVIILGAANNISRMDAALMRAGRFGDRIIEIPLPDETALCGIMRHHLAGDLAGVDLLRFARSAAGAAGADVAAWVRAARRLARNENRELMPDDLMRQIVPEDERSADDLRRAAYHEAGHCVASAVLTGQVVDYVTVVARGTSGGRTASPALETAFPIREDLENNIVMMLCGRAAEEFFIGHPSVACSLSSRSDLSRATECIVALHTAWGLGKVPVVRGSLGQASALLREDVDLRRTVDAHMAGLYRRALKLVSDHANAVRLIAAELITARHLDAAGIGRLLKTAGLDLNGAKSERAVVSGSLVPEAPVKHADAGTTVTVKKSSNRTPRRT